MSRSVSLPENKTSYFELFDIQVSFDLDLDKLQATYFRLSRANHPDANVGFSDKQVNMALQNTMDINMAYEILKTPIKRAEYILSLNGITVNQDNQTSVKPSQELLMESMEQREELCSLEDKQSLTGFLEQEKQKANDCISQISQDFLNNDLDKAAQNTIRLRYLQKLEEETKRKIKELK